MRARHRRPEPQHPWRSLFLRIVAIVAAFAALATAAQCSNASTAHAAESRGPAVEVLGTDAETVPSALWEALRAQGYRGIPGDGAERLYVPFGTAVDVPGGHYLATVDGWFACRDWQTFAGKCSATGPVVPLGVGPFPYWPAVAPSGAPIVSGPYEDGSAGYADGLIFDAEERVFRI